MVADPYPPYQYLEGGRVRGCDHEIITESFAARDISIYTKLHSWSACLRSLDLGEAVGIFQITKAPEREHIYLFSQTLRIAKTVLFTTRKVTVDSWAGNDAEEIRNEFNEGLKIIKATGMYDDILCRYGLTKTG